MLSKRERLIAIMAAAILILLPADKFVLSPLMGKLTETAATRQRLIAEDEEAQGLFQRQKLMERRWRQYGGLESESQAESRVLRAVGEWASDSRLTLTSVRPLRVATEGKDVQEMTISVAGTGSLQAASRFLWNVEHAAIPIKVKDMQLGSANDTGNEMSLQLQLSTLYVRAADGKADNG